MYFSILRQGKKDSEIGCSPFREAVASQFFRRIAIREINVNETWKDTRKETRKGEKRESKTKAGDSGTSPCSETAVSRKNGILISVPGDTRKNEPSNGGKKSRERQRERERTLAYAFLRSSRDRRSFCARDINKRRDGDSASPRAYREMRE